MENKPIQKLSILQTIKKHKYQEINTFFKRTQNLMLNNKNILTKINSFEMLPKNEYNEIFNKPLSNLKKSLHIKKKSCCCSRCGNSTLLWKKCLHLRPLNNNSLVPKNCLQFCLHF